MESLDLMREILRMMKGDQRLNDIKLVRSPT